MLKRTRLSLFYVATYLSLTGLAFLLAPVASMRFSDGGYGTIFVQISGALLIVLSVFVIQIIRLRLEILYKTIILVRVFLLAVWVYMYILTSDPVFIFCFAVVGLGVVLSTTALILDQRAEKTNGPK